eukprot:CAMPEP_0202473906 /NCGR_PEP_ID=MMETSP1360-20130828/92097_1 /ASSEMBLY_ACC=CAM_ASM_000848 /TAXON_ID=515479 /ORGANISM="Licmophora paradoxa, Strain CCMP2313" /LENGTH=102 /DNA_ID=CAMNT_0049100991 /DNA_START=591 /DNA_END=899 /DNA_ORIENTATION=-
MGGWIISERKRLRQPDTELSRARDASVHLEYIVMMLDVGVIVYYAIIAETITTIAHVCALILGASLSLLSIRLYDDGDDTTTTVDSISAHPGTPLVESVTTK